MEQNKVSGSGLKYQKYSWSFKRQVIIDYLQSGDSCRSVGEKYGISGGRVVEWTKLYGPSIDHKKPSKFSSMTSEEQQQYEKLREENEALKKQLEFAQMQAKAFEILIDLAKDELGIDIRKNSGAKQPIKQSTTTRRQQ